MKTKYPGSNILVVYFLLLSTLSFSQTDTVPYRPQIGNKANASINSRVSADINKLGRAFLKINPLTIQKPAFDTFYRPIFSKVVFGSSDLVNQGSSFSLVSNTYDSKFQVQWSHLIDNNNLRRGFFTAGLSANSSSSVLNLYSKNQWQQGMTLSLGYTNSGFHTTGFRFDQSDFIPKYLHYRSVILASINSVLNLDTALLRRQIFATELDDNILLSDTLANTLLSILPNESALSDAEKKLALNTYYSAVLLDDARTKAFVDSSVSVFQIKYFKKPEFKLSWFNILLKPQYLNTAIYDTAAARLAGIQKQDFLNVAIEVNRYRIHISRNTFFWQVGIGFKTTNFLNGRKPDEIQSLIQQIDSTIQIKTTDEAIVVANFEDYKKRFIAAYPSIGFDYFLGEKRIIGFESFFSTTMGFKPANNPFENVFSARAGVLFSFKGLSDLAKSTFGIFAQFDDVKWKKPSADDTFSLTLRIGIPFTL